MSSELTGICCVTDPVWNELVPHTGTGVGKLLLIVDLEGI